MKRTIADLYTDNYYGLFAELTHRRPDTRLVIEPYEGPFDTVTVGGRADMLMAEFWQKPSRWGWKHVRPTASAAHAYGKTIVAAEAFTGQPNLRPWQQAPYDLKATGDEAFAAGVNLLVLHTYAHQP